MRVDYSGQTLSDDYLVDVELTDTIISNLKKGRAASINHLTAKHLQFSHPAITTILAIVNGIVSDTFSTSFTVLYLNVTHTA